MKKTARAHTNIALVKYWGKEDEELIIPMNGSISLTLDHFYTDTSVEFDPSLKEDVFSLDGRRREDAKIVRFMDLVRSMAQTDAHARIDSVNHVPTAAGLASSASAYAALALAATSAAGLELSRRDLSRLARRGSGSATRSVYGGFVEWVKGHDDLTSFARPVEEDTDWNICMIAVVISGSTKKISSRQGMQRVVSTSPYYRDWVKSAENDLELVRKAVRTRDFTLLGEVSESSAMKMHALNMSAAPHFSYFMPESIAAMQKVEEMREQGIPCYYTMDAGPNVKVICEQKNAERVIDGLAELFPREDILPAKPGPGATLL